MDQDNHKGMDAPGSLATISAPLSTTRSGNFSSLMFDDDQASKFLESFPLDVSTNRHCYFRCNVLIWIIFL